MAAAQKIVTQVQHPTLLEALGIRFSVEVAISMGLTKVIFESDCQPVIYALQKLIPDHSNLMVIVEDIKGRLLEVGDYSFSFVRRQANVAAHLMAKTSCPDNVPSMFFSSIPPMLSDVLMRDTM